METEIMPTVNGKTMRKLEAIRDDLLREAVRRLFYVSHDHDMEAVIKVCAKNGAAYHGFDLTTPGEVRIAVSFRGDQSIYKVRVNS